MACPSYHRRHPDRNRRALLERSLGSVLAQVDVELEVVVVDDGSTDETPTFLSDLDDTRIRVVRNDQATGVTKARNAGIAHAQAKWLASSTTTTSGHRSDCRPSSRRWRRSRNAVGR